MELFPQLCAHDHGTKGLVLHSVNGQLCAEKLYQDQIDLIRTSGRPLKMEFRHPLPNETADPNQHRKSVGDKIAGETKKVQRPVLRKEKSADADRSSVAAPSSSVSASQLSTHNNSQSAFTHFRHSAQKPEEGVPPPLEQASTPSQQTVKASVRQTDEKLRLVLKVLVPTCVN